jgi:hypothetical protein
MFIQTEDFQAAVQEEKDVGIQDEVLNSYLDDVEKGLSTQEEVAGHLRQWSASHLMGLPPMTMGMEPPFLTITGQFTITDSAPLATPTGQECKVIIEDVEGGKRIGPCRFILTSARGSNHFVWNGEVLIDELSHIIQSGYTREAIDNALARNPELKPSVDMVCIEEVIAEAG